MSTPLDLLRTPLADLVRQPMSRQFPGLRPGLHRFDAPGGTLVHAAVRDAVAAYLASEHVANDHGAFPAARFSDALVAWAADQVRGLLGAPGGHLVFGANMTTLTALFLRALAADVGPGDEIVCTALDHEANIVPWQDLARRRGARVRLAPLAPDGLLPVRAVTDLIGPRTRWVAVTAASNALGTVPDVHRIVEAAHAAGARVFVDGVQAVAHLRVDLTAWRCDAFVTSAYKWYGPHCGMLWVADETAAGLRLGEQVPSAGDDLPDRLHLGTTGFESVLGAGAAAAVLREWDAEEISRREHKLADRLMDALEAVPGVRLLTPRTVDRRVPVVTFQIDGRSPAVVAERLAAAGSCVWHGSFYASHALRSVAPENPAAVRAGIACYTREDDVDALVTTVGGIAKESP